jgi:hypothetical protein
MPVDTIIVLVAICSVYLVFGVVTAWLDHSTTKWLQAKAAEKRAAGEPEPSHKRAA